MKTYNKQRNEMKVRVYKDSGSEWMVQGGGHSLMSFDMRKFTLKAAWNFYIDIFESNWKF